MAGYTRADVSNSINDGNVIDASALDSEFDAIVGAFNSSTGHSHDGTAAEGAPIEVVGPAQDFTFTSSAMAPKTDNAYDVGSPSFRIKNLYISGQIVGATLGPISGPFSADRVEATASGTLANPAISINGNSIGFYEVSPNALSITLDGIDKLVVSSTAISTGAGVSFAGSGASLQDLNAEAITSGELAVERLPPSESQDTMTWVASSIVNKYEDRVVNYGNFAMLKNQNTGGEIVAGEIYQGSDLRHSGTDNLSRGSVPGVWRALGSCGVGAATLFIRVGT